MPEAKVDKTFNSLQPCTKLRAKREAFEIAIANLSVRHTDTDKSASILSVSFVALRYASTFTSFRQTTYVFWTFLKGLCGRPSKNMQHCTGSHAPKGGQNASLLMYIFFTLQANNYLEILARSRSFLSSICRSSVKVFAFEK